MIHFLSKGKNTSDATATAADILTGETAYVAMGKVVGELPDTGLANKIYDAPYELHQALPSYTMPYTRYGIAFTTDYKHCARILRVNNAGAIMLGLFDVADDGTSMTLMKISDGNGGIQEAVYTINGDSGTNGLIDGAINESYSKDFFRFEMIQDNKSNPNKCHLYLRGYNATHQRWNSLVPINFDSDTPIVYADVFKFNSGWAVTDYAIIPIPYHSDRCIELVYISGDSLGLYLCSINYSTKEITRITTQLQLNAINPLTPTFSFSEDGQSLLISQPNYNTSDNNTYAPYLVRFDTDFNTWAIKQVTNGNPGAICLSKNGDYAFTNGKLFSISYGTGTTISSIKRIGTTNVIEPLGTNDTAIGYSKVYFSNDSTRLIVAKEGTGIKTYKIDLTGETTATESEITNSTALYFSTQGLDRDRVYACGSYSSGTLYKIEASDETKVLIGLSYKDTNYIDLDTLDATATAEEILAGETAYVNGKKIIGNMKNNGSLQYTPTTSAQTIPAGYTSGGTVAGEANLLPENIKTGITIFGITGTYTGIEE